jgi:integrase/recombinase XerC
MTPTALAVIPAPPPFPARVVSGDGPRDPRRLVAAWLEGRSERTREAYASDLEDFRRFIGAEDGSAAAAALLSNRAGAANELVLAYRTAMTGRGLASATINRRLAALRSLVDLANLLGTVEWSLGIKNVRHERRKDTAGPGETGVRALLEELRGRAGDKGVRDRAMFRLLLDLGLRRFEVVGLDVEHLDLAGARVAVLRKGKKERRPLELPPKCVAALAAWLEVRGTEPGPLFTGFARGKGRRLDGDGLYRMVRELGTAAGVLGLRTHKIRHSAITACRKRAHEAGIPLEEVLDFSGHADVRTLQVYLDRDKSRQGELAALVSEAF